MTTTRRSHVLRSRVATSARVSVALLCLALTGCWGTTSGSATLTVSTPRLVLVSPGVYVVEDQDSAVFYSDDYYWRYDGGVWYRSSYYDDGFVQISVDIVPVHIRRVDRPARYVRYRGAANARVLRHARAYRRDQGARSERPQKDEREHERQEAADARKRQAAEDRRRGDEEKWQKDDEHRRHKAEQERRQNDEQQRHQKDESDRRQKVEKDRREKDEQERRQKAENDEEERNRKQDTDRKAKDDRKRKEADKGRDKDNDEASGHGDQRKDKRGRDR